MDRREFAALIGSITVGAYAGKLNASGHGVCEFGEIAPTAEEYARAGRAPSFHEVYRPLKGIAKATKRNTFLWQYHQKEIGEIIPIDQHVTDCTACAAAMGVRTLSATEIHLLRERQEYKAAAVAPIFWGGRNEIAKGRYDVNMRGHGGMRVEWAKEWLQDFGVLHREVYKRKIDGLHEYEVFDLTKYTSQIVTSRMTVRGGDAVPDWLEAEAKKTPVRMMTHCGTGMEILDAVCSGQPVIIGSTVAFHKERDKDGFCQPYGVRKNGDSYYLIPPLRRQKVWNHSMVVTAALVEGPRLGGGIQNSGGVWNHGPQPFDMPDGAFFADLHVLDLIAKDYNDCWAMSSYGPKEVRRIKTRLYRRR